MNTLAIGVTGSAGSGKSTLCAFWTDRGAELVSGDAVGQELLRTGSPVYRAVVSAFGPGMLAPGGDIDRRSLGTRVFADRRELERLNSLVHPPLLEELHRRLAEFRAHPGPTCILLIDAALLVEWNDRSLWDRLVVVTAPRAAQIERLSSQRGFSAQEAETILAAQRSDEERMRMADHVVRNDGDLDRLCAEAERLWIEWQSMLTSKRGN